MLDIHTHLFWDSYDADRDLVIARARERGVEQMICVGTSPEDNPQAIAVAEKYENIFASVGLHPHYFNQLTDSNKRLTGEIEELRKLAQHEKVVAIGECGLDYFSHDASKIITEEQKAAQKEGFLAQLLLAQESGLPVIIHCRDAYQEVYEILKNHNSRFQVPESRFILHCYMGDTEVTEKFLTLPNVFFSFTGNITYPVKKALVGTKDDLTETVKQIPLDKLFIETDCPFLAPQGRRGERNEPAYAIETAEKVCALKGAERAALERILEENFRRVFAHTEA